MLSKLGVNLPTSGPLIIQPSQIDQAAIRAAWASLLPSSCTLLGASLFGDLFLARESGEIDMLNVLSGELKQVAVCIEEFEWDLSQRERREELLMQSLADATLSAGLKPGPGECLAFRTPPILGGQLRPDNLVLWNLAAYHGGLAKLFPQIKDLPLGTQIVPKF